MIIENFYQTKIECVKDSDDSSYYNVNIDATDIRVEVSLIDFNGNPIIGKNVTLNVDRGTITSIKSGYNGTIASGKKSVTGTTGADGKLAVLYTASEWGLATFTVNNINTQINVGGWRVVQNDGIYYLKYNDKLVYAIINYTTSVNWSTTISHLGAEWLKDRTRGIDLRPPMTISVSPSANKNIMIANNDYRVGWFTDSGTATGGLYAHFLYGRR